MSKLAERLPILADVDMRLPVTTNVLEDVVVNGRVDKATLVDRITDRLADEEVDLQVIEAEARHAIAEQFVSAWAARSTIRFDRNQRVPVYQTEFGFAESYFKVGSAFVKPEAMTVEDFNVMLERYDRRIQNAQTDRSIIAEFFDRARPGLESGQSLVDLFDRGDLELAAANAPAEIEEGDES